MLHGMCVGIWDGTERRDKALLEAGCVGGRCPHRGPCLGNSLAELIAGQWPEI